MTNSAELWLDTKQMWSLYMSSTLPHTQKKTECRKEVNDVGSSYEKCTL